jgi:hypothetical protein
MQSSGVVGYVETAARHRAALYRDRAAQLRKMAQAEPIGSLRSRLLGLARNYEEMAAGVATQSRRSIPARSSHHPDRTNPIEKPNRRKR